MEPFIEIASAQKNKHGMLVCGDAFEVKRLENNKRILAVLSDGLGSGIKASILAKMTVSMALKFLATDKDLISSMKVIMDTLPVCQTRQISYATFSIIDSTIGGSTRIIEMGNPSFMHFSGNKLQEHKAIELHSAGWEQRAYRVTDFVPKPEDRIIICSDGVTQAGLGRDKCKLGFRRNGVAESCSKKIKSNSTISANNLANHILRSALKCEEQFKNYDDMTAGIFYFRNPRTLTVLAGPPFQESKDEMYVEKFIHSQGKKIICGGTTCNIVSRITGREPTTILRRRGNLPLTAEMKGIDLVTEGVLTLTRVAKILEENPSEKEDSPAQDMVNIFLECDKIHFMLGTRINEAHQDPTLPQELAFRRTLIKKISSLLEKKYLKEISLELI